MTFPSRTLFALGLFGLVAATPAHAEVPTTADFAACNMKAAEAAASDAVSASPRTDLPSDATRIPADARPRPAAPGVLQERGPALSSDRDPQIEGLAADRADDKTYVAAYRACMRQRGF